MLIHTDLAAIRKAQPDEYAVRFLFGGSITLLAGLVAQFYGPTIGGLFLAFPAIFPAGVTLIAKHEERRRRAKGLEGRERGKLAAGGGVSGGRHDAPGA